MLEPQYIQTTWKRIKPFIRQTPIIEMQQHQKQLPYPSHVFLKLECMQVTGSSKVRGVTAKLLSLPKNILLKGVVTASIGGQGFAVAHAGWMHRVPVCIYLPQTTPLSRVGRLERLGAKLIMAGKNFEDSLRLAHAHAQKKGQVFLNPLSDTEFQAGQGTLLVEDLLYFDFDMIIGAIESGVMMAGVGGLAKCLHPKCKVVGVQTHHDRFLSRQTLSTDSFRSSVDKVIGVDDQETGRISKWLATEFALNVEDKGAAPLAAFLTGKIPAKPHEKVCIIVDDARYRHG